MNTYHNIEKYTLYTATSEYLIHNPIQAPKQNFQHLLVNV